jgi:hypothetical protein
LKTILETFSIEKVKWRQTNLSLSIVFGVKI